MKKLMAVFLSGTYLISAAAWADHAACLSQKSNAGWRLSRINAMFADGGKCASLKEDSLSAVRADSGTASLDNFRKLKADWLVDFDGTNPYALKYDLDQVRTSASELLKAPSDSVSSEIRRKAQVLVTKIDRLYRAVDRMRPNGGTTPDNVAAIDGAFDSLDGACPNDHSGTQCPGYGPGALTDLFQSIQADSDYEKKPVLKAVYTAINSTNPSDSRAEFDNLHAILDCRLSDASLAMVKADASKSCPEDPASLGNFNLFPDRNSPAAIATGLTLLDWRKLLSLGWIPAPGSVNDNAASAPDAPAAIAPPAANPANAGSAKSADGTTLDGGTQ
jgi:hypothetical protein